MLEACLDGVTLEHKTHSCYHGQFCQSPEPINQQVQLNEVINRLVAQNSFLYHVQGCSPIEWSAVEHVGEGMRWH